MVQVITKIHMDILCLISEYVNTIQLISDRLKLPRTTVKRRLDELLEHHYIARVPDGKTHIYLITSTGNSAKTIFSSTPENARKLIGEVLKAHKVQWSAVIVEKPWELASDLEKHSFTVSSHKNWDKWTYYDIDNDLTIVFNPNKVHVFLHEFFIDSPMEYYDRAKEACIKVCMDLQEKFPGLKLGTPKKVFTVHSQHIVKQGGPLAKAFEHHAEVTGVSQVYHGKNLDIDHSDGPWEEETKDPKVAPAHMEDLGHFFDVWLDKPFFPQEIHDMKQDVSDVEQKQVTSEQAISNLEQKHTSMEQSMNNKVDELSHQMSASESSIKHEMTLQHSTLRKDMELLGKGLVKLSEGQMVLSKGQEILQAGHTTLGNSIDKLYESHEAQNNAMSTFAVAMDEHVALIKILQKTSKSNADNFNKGLDMLYKSHLEMLDMIKELKKPWYLKFSESMKQLFSKHKK